MSDVAVVLSLSRAALRERMRAGFPVARDCLADTAWLGVSLGLPRWAERLSWKTFSKCFVCQPGTGALTGFNVRLRQDGIGAEPVPMRRNGRAITFGHFEVVATPPAGPGSDLPEGLTLDYGRGGNGWWNPISLLRDPIVALGPEPGAPMLGWSWLALGSGIGTPSYFVLSRIGRAEELLNG
jgi:hypothetical protein